MRKIRTFIAVACLLIPTLLGLTGTNAIYADTVDIASVSPVTGSIETYVNGDIPDNDELFSGYVEQVFGNGEGVSLYGSKAGDGLNASAKHMYDLLKADIAKVAEGKLSSSVFTYTTEDIDFKTSWTAAELGVSSIVVNGEINKDATATIEKYIKKKCIADISTYIDALLADCPYELYWYDKVSGTGSSYSTGNISAIYENEEYVLKCSPVVMFKMYVAKEYSASNTSGTTDLLVSKTGAAMNAADNAKKLVSACEPLSDYYKMLAYKKYICNQVVYNTEAASSSTMPYGDPWQMIYVFDNNPDTNVVCEGYSKAFQYLCDMSQFNNDSLYSIIITGAMNGGAHMWNIVHIDGKNYLVDITNCDGRSYGESENLFMRGYTGGSAASGYIIHIPRIEWTEGNQTWYVDARDITYTYDTHTCNIYDESELILSAVDYDKPDRAGLICPHTDTDNNNCCDICLTDSYNIVVYNRTDVSSGSVATIPDVSAKYSGEKATVNAPDKMSQGYSFLGWYEVKTTEDNKVTSYGNKLSSTLSYTFTVNNDVALVAVYKANGNAVINISVENGNGAGYSVNGGDIVYGESDKNVLLGSVVTITASNPDAVFQWTNDNGRVLGTSGTLQLVVTGNINVNLVYKEISASKVYVEYVSETGQLISYELLGSKDIATIPQGPTKLGYRFMYWTIDGNNQATATAIQNEVGNAILNKTDSIIVKPRYEKNNNTCSMTVYPVLNNTVDESAKKVLSTLDFGSTTIITADSIEGYNFKCFAADMNADVILGYNEQLFVQVTGNKSLYAIYEPVEEEAIVVETPVVNITDMLAVDDNGIHKVSCGATRYVPEGYTLLEQGMLFGAVDENINEEQFVYGTDGIRRYVASDKKNNGVLRLNIKVADDDSRIFCRAYMVVKNEATGNQEYIYSNIENGSYNSVSSK